VAAHLFEIPERQAVTLVLPDPGRRKLRMIFRHSDILRVMCWLSIGGDGSLYFDHSLEESKRITQVEAIADGAGGWSEAGKVRELLLSDIDEKSPKLSQHASGVVRRADHRSRSLSFRDLGTSPVLIRQDEYRHPSHYRTVESGKLRIADVRVPAFGGSAYILDENRPLTSRLFVSRLQGGDANVTVVEEAEVDAQTSIVLPATNLRGCQDLLFQLVFWNYPPRPWPDMATAGILDAVQGSEGDAG
jgi:hypothetical protein